MDFLTAFPSIINLVSKLNHAVWTQTEGANLLTTSSGTFFLKPPHREWRPIQKRSALGDQKDKNLKMEPSEQDCSLIKCRGFWLRPVTDHNLHMFKIQHHDYGWLKFWQTKILDRGFWSLLILGFVLYACGCLIDFQNKFWGPSQENISISCFITPDSMFGTLRMFSKKNSGLFLLASKASRPHPSQAPWRHIF